jgi:alkaline phosphatase
MKEAQNNLERTLDTLLSWIQKEELRSYSDHETKMFLLGKQMKHKLHLAQQRELDLSVKLQLEAIDDFRTLELELNPMCGRTYTRPPEESMQQAALWDRMWRQQQGRTEEATSSDQTLQEPWEYDDSTGE